MSKQEEPVTVCYWCGLAEGKHASNCAQPLLAHLRSDIAKALEREKKLRALLQEASDSFGCDGDCKNETGWECEYCSVVNKIDAYLTATDKEPGAGE